MFYFDIKTAGSMVIHPWTYSSVIYKSIFKLELVFHTLRDKKCHIVAHIFFTVY